MKPKHFIFALGLLSCIIPGNIQGESKSGGKPRVQAMSISPVHIETESRIIFLYFYFNLGEVAIELQDTDGIIVLSEIINTSLNNQVSFGIPAGVYLLTVTTTDGAELTHAYIMIPE